MGEEETPKTQHVIYGSAGMAASGMMPGTRAKSKPKSEPEIAAPAPEEVIEADLEAPVEESEAPAAPAAPVTPPVFQGLKAAVIGHTGSGDFGHGLDQIFQRLDGVRLFALADGNASVVKETQARAGAPHGYTDFRTLLAEESPDLVSVAPLWSDQRYAMTRAALESGAHVISEAPLAQTLKEADELVALAAEKGLQLSVLSPMRLDPHVLKFHAEIAQVIGDLRLMRVWGACDATAGGEDLILAGIPLFDLVRLFAGEASYCTASISKEGFAAIAEDAHESETSQLGPLLGDSIHAEIEMDSGVRVSFVSDLKLASSLGPAGIEFIGSKSRLRLYAGAPVTLSLLKNPSPASANRTEQWVQWPEVAGPYHAEVDQMTGPGAANRLVVKDWLAAVQSGTGLSCSGLQALKALEMAHGIWQAGVTMKRAYFPLANRLHPLSEDSR